MKNCKACGSEFPATMVIDGKFRNLYNRKYCFECSPFGKHNTRNIEGGAKGNRVLVHERRCVECGREYNSANRKGAKCFACYFRTKSKKRSDMVYGIVGDACWICEYDKGITGRRILDFHHMDGTQKAFSLDIRGLTGRAWSEVKKEMMKCALLCCRCHSELHAGILDEGDVRIAYEKEWKDRAVDS